LNYQHRTRWTLYIILQETVFYCYKNW